MSAVGQVLPVGKKSSTAAISLMLTYVLGSERLHRWPFSIGMNGKATIEAG